MGLTLPIGNPRLKVLYTVIELSLIFYGATLGYLHILPTLYLIVVIQAYTTANQVCLVIEDDGRGFNPEQQTSPGFELQGMQERVAAVHGTFQLQTEPGMGCRIKIALPLQEVSASDSQSNDPLVTQ